MPHLISRKKRIYPVGEAFAGYLQHYDRGVALPLSSSEFRLLTALLERPKIALTRNQLLDLTKGRDADLFDRSIDNHVSRLRKKIEPDPKNPRYIKTVWGGGYIFAMDPEIA